MEFGDAAVILICAPNAAFEEFFVQSGSLVGCGVPCVGELSDYICELCVSACVKKLCECGCCVLSGWVLVSLCCSFHPGVNVRTIPVLVVGRGCLGISCGVLCDGLASGVVGGVVGFREVGSLSYIIDGCGLSLIFRLF